MSGATLVSKRELRAIMLGRRQIMPSDVVAGLSAQAQSNLLAQPVWKNAASIAMYKAIQNEVDTNMLFDAALAAGKKLFLPRVRRGERGVMDFARCRGAHELVRGAYDILEPAPYIPDCVFIDPGEYAPDSRPAVKDYGHPDAVAAAPELFIIPGVIFDRNGHRLGFGGGYYDRFLSSRLLRAHSLFVGFAYSFQVMESLPVESWDQPVQALCTDSAYEEFRR